MSSNLRQSTEKFIEIRSKRRALEAQAKELKEQELELQNIILQEMASSGTKSVNFDGLARVVSRTTTHYEVTDINLLARAILSRIVDAANRNIPLSEGLLLQFRPSRERVDAIMENMDESKRTAALANMGLVLAERNELSITKR